MKCVNVDGMSGDLRVYGKGRQEGEKEKNI